MNPFKHSTANKVFNAPTDWNAERDGECVPLHVRAAREDSMITITSHWQPSSAELLMLNAGGSVALKIYGGGMPPVSIGVETPDDPPRKAGQVMYNLMDKQRTLQLLRSAIDQVERERMQLLAGPEWVGVTMDDEQRIVHLRVDLKLMP